MNSIFARRSIRKYRPGDVPEEVMRTCLEAAMHAPSAGNEQPWEFVVTRTKEGLQALGDAHPYGKMLPGAAAAVTVCGNRAKQKFPQDYWIQDCSNAALNFMLQAHSMGFGTVWLAIYPCEDRVESIGRLLKLPPEVIPLCTISMGLPGEEREAGDRYRPEAIHRETW